MNRKLIDDLISQYQTVLEEYIAQPVEDKLNAVYELGRSIMSENIGFLDIIEAHHQILNKHLLNARQIHVEKNEVLNRSARFLAECFASYEMSQRGFQDLITVLRNQNAQLQDEIANRRKSEIALKKSEAYFRSLIEFGTDIISILDRDGTIIYESPSIQFMLGYRPAEILGENAFTYIHPEDLPRVLKTFNEKIRIPGSRARVSFRFKHKNGEWRYLEANGHNLIDDPNVQGIIVNSRDVTDRKLAEDELRGSQKRLVMAQQISHMGNWVLNIKENTLQVSDELCHLYGFTRREFEEDQLILLKHIHPDDLNQLKEMAIKAIKNKKPFSFEHSLKRKDNKEISVMYGRAEVIVNEEGEASQLVGFSQDITERKKIEEQLQQSQTQLRKLAAKLEKVREEERIVIAREVHDELGQMLTVLKMDLSLVGFNEEVGKREKISKVVASDLKAISKTVDQIIESVQRIATTLRPEVLDNLGLKEAIEWQISQFKKINGLHFQFTTNMDEFPLSDDKTTAVFRIFQEIITNILRHADATKVVIILRKERDNIKLKISDNGIGIKDEEIVSPNSMGIIGMRERVLFLGGKLTVKGIPGKGTTVEAKIPV